MINSHDDLSKAVDRLASSDHRLAEIKTSYGYPPLWKRDESFTTLLQIILEQQVSLESAKATYEKLKKLSRGRVGPTGFLRLTDQELKHCGFSHQKTRYGRELARSIQSRSLHLKSLRSLSDEEVLKALTAITGIGQWSADVYRLMAMGRADIWPLCDVALAKSLSAIFELSSSPGTDQQLELVETWRPYRSVAARLLWLKYLRERGREVAEF